MVKVDIQLNTHVQYYNYVTIVGRKIHLLIFLHSSPNYLENVLYHF